MKSAGFHVTIISKDQGYMHTNKIADLLF